MHFAQLKAGNFVGLNQWQQKPFLFYSILSKIWDLQRTAFLRFWTLNLLQNQMCLCFVSFPEAFCCHGDLHSALPVWSVVQSCLSLPGPSLPVPKQKLCSCCTGTCDCCTDLFLVIIPSHVSLSPSKLWHWLNKQVMTLRSPVLTERLTDHESVWFERNKVKFKKKDTAFYIVCERSVKTHP